MGWRLDRAGLHTTTGEDEDDDGPSYSDWETSSEDDEVKAKPAATAAAPPKKKGMLKQKPAEKKAARRAQLAAGGSDADYNEDAVLDPRAKARLEKERELGSELHNATELFGSSTLKGASSPFSHICALAPLPMLDLDDIPKSSPSSKEDFVALSEAIIAYIVKRHQDKPLYSTFVASGLTTLANEKQREKTSGKKKPKAAAKPVLAASQVGNKLDTTVYDEALDDFGSKADDFM
ncbi:translation initiation factor eIF3 subunit [Lactarius deliciosus]|nr:translation initiation factor eIF3 subunit [Lactarius deliciosus]